MWSTSPPNRTRFTCCDLAAYRVGCRYLFFAVGRLEAKQQTAVIREIVVVYSDVLILSILKGNE